MKAWIWLRPRRERRRRLGDGTLARTPWSLTAAAPRQGWHRLWSGRVERPFQAKVAQHRPRKGRRRRRAPSQARPPGSLPTPPRGRGPRPLGASLAKLPPPALARSQALAEGRPGSAGSSAWPPRDRSNPRWRAREAARRADAEGSPEGAAWFARGSADRGST